MTTVGYGDKIPVSFSGKIAGSCCAMMGILCMSFPVPGLFSSFLRLRWRKNAGPRVGPRVGPIDGPGIYVCKYIF